MLYKQVNLNKHLIGKEWRQTPSILFFAVVGACPAQSGSQKFAERQATSINMYPANFWGTNNLPQPMNHITNARIKLEQQC